MAGRKDRYTERERLLARLTYFEEFMKRFLKQYSKPTRRWPGVEGALEEVARVRLLMITEQEEERSLGRMGGG